MGNTQDSWVTSPKRRDDTSDRRNAGLQPRRRASIFPKTEINEVKS
jgi:hypothetical protein